MSAMQAVIFAGGRGTRMGESSETCPKPMVEVGGMPILFHLMNMYWHSSKHQVGEFIICLGYMADYFENYFSRRYPVADSDVKASGAGISAGAGEPPSEVSKDHLGKYSVYTVGPWKVTLLDTGLDTMTGGRLKKASYHLRRSEPFCLAYGDGLSNHSIDESIRYHNANTVCNGVLVTVTAFRPRSRFGVIKLSSKFDGYKVSSFQEKPVEKNWVNIGFFVFSPETIPFLQSFVTSDSMVFEREPLNRFTVLNQLMAYPHAGGEPFWQCMDTMVERDILEKYWDEGAPWKTWSEEEEIRPVSAASAVLPPPRLARVLSSTSVCSASACSADPKDPPDRDSVATRRSSSCEDLVDRGAW